MATVAGGASRPSAQASGRIDSLTGLRFVAALSVLVEHFPELVPGVSPERLAQGGGGVSLFFVLSGFLLTVRYRASLGDRPGRARYRFGRVTRIAPLHVAALAIVVPIVVIQSDPFTTYGAGRATVSVLANLGLVHAWVPAQVMYIWNGPAWSISVEMFFYAMLPVLLVAISGRHTTRAPARLIAALLAAQTFVWLIGSWLVGRFLLSRSDDIVGTRLIVSRLANIPALRVGEFAAGCLVGVVFASRAAGARPWPRLESPRFRLGLLLAAIAAVVAIQFTPSCPATACYPDAQNAAALIDLRLFAVYAPIAVVVIAALAWGPTPIGRLLERPTMVRLGEASYALYIFQWIPWLLLYDGGRTERGFWPVFLTVVATVIASVAIHRWFEVPVDRTLRRRRESRQAVSRTDA
ncbi:MAG: acyltransferase [Ilumatobacter sp.]|nr:acyltransferase [Ilumatobacter sp.]